MKTIAQNVRRHRERLSWTQAHLAQAAEVSERTVQRIERGEPIAAESMLSVAGALGVDVEQLRFDEAGVEEALGQLRTGEQQAELTPVIMVKMERGADAAYLLNTHAMYFDDSGLRSDGARDVAAELNGWFQDCIDVWAEIAPPMRRELERDLDRLLVRARDAGVFVSVGKIQRRITFPNDPLPSVPLQWDFLVVTAAPEFKRVVMIPKRAPLV